MTSKQANSHRLLKAQYVLPVSSAPIRDGFVEIEHKMIRSLGKLETRQDQAALPDAASSADDSIAETIDFGRAIIVPGLINLHTHLDYSGLRGFDTTSNMFTWLKKLVGASSRWTGDDWSRSSFYGAKAAALSGTSLVVDNSFSGMSALALAKLGLRAVIGLELFGLKNDESAVAWMNWKSKYETLTGLSNESFEDAIKGGLIKITVAPHAPYTVCPHLWEKAAIWSEENKLPLLAHVSESAQECSWITSGDPQVDAHLEFVRSLRATAGGSTSTIPELDKITWKGKGHSPVGHLQHHGLLSERLLAAHGTHFTPGEIEHLAHEDVKVAHCPRSNARLRNGLAPLKAFIESGLTFGLGTDSLASCDDLDLLNEARFAASAHRIAQPDLDWNAEKILRSMTLDAARAIDMEDTIGSLEPGKSADLAIFQIDGNGDSGSTSPENLMMHGGCSLHTLIVDGEIIVSGGRLVTEDERFAMDCL